MAWKRRPSASAGSRLSRWRDQPAPRRPGEGTTVGARLLLPATLLLAVLCSGAVARADDAPLVVPGAPNLQPPPPPQGEAAPPAAIPSSSPPPGGGDAEPAPAEAAVPPPPFGGGPIVSDSPTRTGRHQLAFGARFGYRLGDAGKAISPAAGYGIVGTYDFTYARVGDALELAAGVDFSSDRFATAEHGTVIEGIGGGNSVMTGTYDSTRVLSENHFVLAQTFALLAGRVRPFVVLGLGLGVGSFQTVDMRYISIGKSSGGETDTHLLGRAALGTDVQVGSGWAVRLRADYTAVRRTAPFVTGAGQTLPLFGDLLDIDVQAVYRF